MASSLVARLHINFQGKIASPLDEWELIEPRSLRACDVLSAREKGAAICSKIPPLRVEFLLYGVSAFIAHGWASVISNLWIAIEQVVGFLWQERVIAGGEQPTELIEGRSGFLKDHRTWVISARLELLFQLRAIAEGTYRALNVVRKARNELAHRGLIPNRAAADAALEAVFQLVASIATPEDIHSFAGSLSEFRGFDLVKRHYEPPTRPRSVEDFDEDTRWIGPMPPIPGEPEWGDREFVNPYTSFK